MPNGRRWSVSYPRRFAATGLAAAAVFVGCAGAGMGSWAVGALGVALLVVAVSLVVVSAVRNNARSFVRGTGHVLDVTEPPANVSVGRCEMQIVIEAPGLASAKIKVRDSRVPVAKWPDIGDTLPIRVAIEDPRHVRILWDEVPTHGEERAEEERFHEHVQRILDADEQERRRDAEDERMAAAEQSAAAPLTVPRPRPSPHPRSRPRPSPRPRRPQGDTPSPHRQGGIQLQGDIRSPGPQGDVRPIDAARAVSSQDALAGRDPSSSAVSSPRVPVARDREGAAQPPSATLDTAPARGVSPPVAASAQAADPPVAASTQAEADTRAEAGTRAEAAARVAPDTPAQTGPWAAVPERRANQVGAWVAPGDLAVNDVAPIEGASAVLGVPPDERPREGVIHGVGVTLMVTNLHRSIDFYRSLLGFSVVDSGPTSAVLTANDTRIMLRAVPEMARVDRRLVHLNLEVSDVDAAYARLRERGVRFLHRPRPIVRGEQMDLWAAAFRDPDGHGIALVRWQPRDHGTAVAPRD